VSTSPDVSILPTEKLRLAFVISSLGFGGAERDLSKCANFWAKEGADVCIFVFTTSQSPSVYSLDDRVKVCFLKDHFHHIPVAKMSAFPRRIFCIIALRQALKRFQPRVVVSYMDIVNITTLLVCKGLSIPVIVSERTDPVHCRIWGPFHFLWDKLRLCTYSHAHRIVVQTSSVAAYFSSHFERNICTIPNAVMKPQQHCLIQQKVRMLVSVGRLNRCKAFDVLIQAFGLMRKEYPSVCLTIYGEGSYRKRLERLIREKDLQEQVSLPGVTTHLQEELLQADIFIFPSLYEGFPNALCEAMALGLPVIASDCSGNTTVVQDGVDGLIFPVGNVSALVQKLKFLIENFEERQRLSRNARCLPERFPEALNHRLWKEVIFSAVDSRRPSC
jgi:glycosyltransferase involved in cell wall biosynthesis